MSVIPQESVTTTDELKIGGAFVLIGGVLAIVSPFLNWFVLNAGARGVSLSETGWDWGIVAAGVLAAGVGLAVVGIAMFVSDKVPEAMVRGTIGSSLVLAAAAIYSYMDVTEMIETVPRLVRRFGEVEVGPGVWLLCGAALTAIVGTALVQKAIPRVDAAAHIPASE